MYHLAASSARRILKGETWGESGVFLNKPLQNRLGKGWRATGPRFPRVGTVRYRHLVPKDAEGAKKLQKRTLTNLYNECPTGLALAHQKLEAVCWQQFGPFDTIFSKEFTSHLTEEVVNTYSPPVDQLLAIGEPGFGSWADYKRYGITAEHVPDLIRMMLDMDLHQADGDSKAVWGPLHAWRAASQFPCAEATRAYLDMLARVSEFEELHGEWENEDAPKFFARMGPEAITGLADFLDDHLQSPYARMAIAETLSALAGKHPDRRSQVVAILARQLERPESQGEVNGAVVAGLVDLDAAEAALAIEQAFRAGKIDESVAGGWAHVGYELGVVAAPPPVRYAPFQSTPLPGETDTRTKRKKDKAKAKRKMARASRKRNRR